MSVRDRTALGAERFEIQTATGRVTRLAYLAYCIVVIRLLINKCIAYILMSVNFTRRTSAVESVALTSVSRLNKLPTPGQHMVWMQYNIMPILW